MANKSSDGKMHVMNFIKDVADHPQVLYINDSVTSKSIMVLSPKDMSPEMVHEFLMGYCCDYMTELLDDEEEDEY